jgi:integrase
LKVGLEPVRTRRLDRAAEVASSNATFASVAEEWLRKEEATWSQVHARKARRAIERHVLPVLGKLPVRDITPAIVGDMIEAIQARGVRETAMKILQHVRSIFRYATARAVHGQPRLRGDRSHQATGTEEAPPGPAYVRRARRCPAPW